MSDLASATLALASRLVSITSENPPGLTTEVCDVVARELEEGGFAVEYVESEPGFTNVVATYAFGRPGRTLLLNGHVDVVPVGAAEWTSDPWGAEVRDGLLYGRGSLDMKGPLAALVAAAREVVGSGTELGGRLLVAAVADEEHGGRRGMGALLDAGKLAADGAVIAEPGDGGVVIGHRGMCFVRLTTRGVAAHASMPENGVNAVGAMVDVLQSCRTLRLEHTAHPLLGSPTVAIGTTIAGGERPNVVPDACTSTLDVRTVPGMTRDGVIDDIRAHLAAQLCDGQVPEVEVLVWGEPGVTDAEADIVRVAAEAFTREFGYEPELRPMPAATDGWWLTNRAGIPTVMGLAPGGIAGCHVVDEHVDVHDLGCYARVYADIIRTFLRA